jgi:GAF domain-containing protein
MVVCRQCRDVFNTIGGALNEQLDAPRVLQLVAETLSEQFDLYGCQFRLLSRDQRILESVAFHGVSRKFLDKGPVDAERSVVESLEGRTVMILDCKSDPRIQYPKAAKKEGIASILSVPIMLGDDAIGAIRVYTADKWEFTLENVNFVQALAQIAGILIEMTRLYQGQNEHIEALTTMCESPAL